MGFKRLALIPVLLFCVLLTACGPREHSRQCFAMDTVMTLTVWGDESIPGELQKLLQNMENDLSVTRPDSLVSRLNAGQELTLSREYGELLRRAQVLEEETGGAFCPWLYPVTKLWGFTTGQYRVPGERELETALASTGQDPMHWEGDTLRLEKGAELDLGAIVKGWAGEQCVSRLKACPEAVAALLSLGGNIQTYGEKPDGSPWRIGVQSPFGEGLAGTLELRGTWAVVTSGGYERYFEENGVRYTHILDPATGRPAQSGLASVTVVCADGLRADALSTALLVMGREKAMALWEAWGDFEAVLIEMDGTVTLTSGLENAFSPAG